MRRVTPMNSESSSPGGLLLPIGKAASQLGVSVDTIRRWEAAGTLAAIRLPSGQRRFRQSDVDRLLASGRAS